MKGWEKYGNGGSEGELKGKWWFKSVSECKMRQKGENEARRGAGG